MNQPFHESQFNYFLNKRRSCLYDDIELEGLDYKINVLDQFMQHHKDKINPFKSIEISKKDEIEFQRDMQRHIHE